jgi:type IV secretory pathway VirB10-like protein
MPLSNPALPRAPGFPWRKILLGVLILALPVLWWVAQGLRPKAPSSDVPREARVTRASGRNLLDRVPTSAVGVAQEMPAPEVRVVETPSAAAPVDTSARDQVVEQLTRDNQALLARLKALEGRQPMPQGKPPAHGDQGATQRREARLKEEDEARTTLDVWSAPREAQKTGVQTPATPYSVPPGTQIDCQTEYEVTNQAPGAFRAWVTRPVYAARGALVIPGGSKLLMRTAATSIAGDQRLPVRVDTLTFPNDRYVRFEAATVADQHGAAGFQDQIDRRLPMLFASILLTGVLRSGSGVMAGYSGDAGERVAGSVISETASQGTQQVRQVIRTEPIMTIRPRYACVVLLEQELVLDGPYVD